MHSFLQKSHNKTKKQEIDAMSTKQKYDIGEQSLIFPNPVYLISGASVVGKKEGEGPLGSAFDMICDDDKFGEDTWEMAESTLQKEALSLAMGKAGLKPEDIRYLFAGDLLGQNIATSFGLMDYEIPLFGLYGACSTAGESLSLASMCVGAGYRKRSLFIVRQEGGHTNYRSYHW